MGTHYKSHGVHISKQHKKLKSEVSLLSELMMSTIELILNYSKELSKPEQTSSSIKIYVKLISDRHAVLKECKRSMDRCITPFKNLGNEALDDFEILTNHISFITAIMNITAAYLTYIRDEYDYSGDKVVNTANYLNSKISSECYTISFLNKLKRKG